MEWCLRKVRLFLLGPSNFITMTDLPLVGLFRDNSLIDVLNPRRFHVKYPETTLQFRCTPKYLPGNIIKHLNPFRFFALKMMPDEDDVNHDGDIRNVVCKVSVTVVNQDSIVVMDEETVTTVAAEEPDYQLLISKVQ